MWTIAPVLSMCLALGKSITRQWLMCPIAHSPCDDGMAGTIFFVLPFIVMYLQIPMGCQGDCRYSIFRGEVVQEKNKYIKVL